MFKKAKRSRDKFFTVLCRETKLKTPRLGLAISKKHCRKATARNRIKRAIRESFRQHQAELTGLDIVVMNQPAASMGGNDSMRESLTQHWQRCRAAKRQNKTQDS